MNKIIFVGMSVLFAGNVVATNVVWVIHLNWLDENDERSTYYSKGTKSDFAPIATFDGEHLFIYTDVATVTATIVDEAGIVVYEGAGVNEGGCIVLDAQQVSKGRYALYVETEKGTYGGEFSIE